MSQHLTFLVAPAVSVGQKVSTWEVPTMKHGGGGVMGGVACYTVGVGGVGLQSEMQSAVCV